MGLVIYGYFWIIWNLKVKVLDFYRKFEKEVRNLFGNFLFNDIIVIIFKICKYFFYDLFGWYVDDYDKDWCYN